jgi:hypothetical protein
MKLFASIFLGIGLLFAIIGLGWLYVLINSSDTLVFSEEWIGPLVFSGIGLIFTAVGGGTFYYQAKQKARREMLLRSGRKLRAVISNLYYNTNISINKRHPLVIECVAEVSGRKQNFKSHNVWGSTQFEVGQEVAVYMDNRDINNYWVEVGE